MCNRKPNRTDPVENEIIFQYWASALTTLLISPVQQAVASVHCHAQRPKIVVSGHRDKTMRTVQIILPQFNTKYLVIYKTVLHLQGSVTGRWKVFPEKWCPIDLSSWPFFRQLASKYRHYVWIRVISDTAVTIHLHSLDTSAASDYWFIGKLLVQYPTSVIQFLRTGFSLPRSVPVS